MNWFLGAIFIIISIYLISRFYAKKRRVKIKEHIKNSWGKPKSNSESNFYLIGRYFHQQNLTNNYFLDDSTCKDLDIDDVFNFIDRTSSKIGQQYLYAKLRTSASIEELKKRDNFANYFKSENKTRLNTQFELSKLNNHNSYYFTTLFSNETIEIPKTIWLVKLCTFLAIALLIYGFFNPWGFIAFLPIFIVNLFFHYKNKGDLEMYQNSISEINKTYSVAETLLKVAGIKNYFSDVSFLQKISSIKRKSQFISLEKNLDSEGAAIVWLATELIKISFNIEYLVFYSFINGISKEKEALKKLFLCIGEIDMAISIASIKNGKLPFCTPKKTNNKQLIFSNIYHPLIENCTTNSLNLNNKSLLLTGSNMSGKTTFIRTIALNNILAQTLYLCFAKSFEAPFLKVFSSIRITDNLQSNTSYFLEEVLTTKEFIEASNQKEPCLFILDEIFKGTNTIERISGGKAILSHLNSKNHIVLVSTHDIELTDLLAEDKYDLYHFNEQITDNKLTFDHKLKKGRLQTRNAIKILEIYGYPKEVIEEAKRIETIISK